MINPLQGTAEEKVKTILATFKNLGQRLIPYLQIVNSIYKTDSPEFARRQEEQSRKLNEPKNSKAVHEAILKEAYDTATKRQGWDPQTVIFQFFTETARFYATASPQHQEEIAKPFKGYTMVGNYTIGFADYAVQQMVAFPGEGDVWLGLALIMLGLEAAKYDPDAYIAIERLIDNATAAGVNPGPVIQEIAPIVPKTARWYIDRSR